MGDGGREGVCVFYRNRTEKTPLRTGGGRWWERGQSEGKGKGMGVEYDSVVKGRKVWRVCVCVCVCVTMLV